jgi:hypothetical protein
MNIVDMLIAAILMMTLSLPGFAQPEPEEEETGQFKRGIMRPTTGVIPLYPGKKPGPTQTQTTGPRKLQLSPIADKLKKPGPVRKSDLAVRGIYATCVCPQTKKVGAILFSNLKVEVTNFQPSNVATKGQVKVSFHNLQTGTFQTLVKNIPLLGVGKRITVEVYSNPLLVRESTKISAQVQPIGTTDLNLSNNVKNVGYDVCNRPPIR